MGRILIADDEEHILGVMTDVLESAGHEVTGVTDGEQALAMLEKKNFDVALIDVMMPKLDGYHLVTKIQGLKNPPKVAIVTARNFDTDSRIIHAVGAAAFLPKPFSKHELIDVVNKLLGSAGAQQK
ncbi:MAG: response regulator [Elusimicrobia bacterium]|nr:response regulator [Candidatus Obscuribacterium magneticum]